MKKPFAWIAPLSLTLSSTAVFAHPGAHHGTLLEMINHLLSQPDHRVLIVMALVSCVIGLALVPDSKQKGSSDDPR